MQEMLFSKKGINWSEYPEFFKNGTLFLRRKTEVPFTADELQNLPPKHHARTNSDLMVKRTSIEQYHHVLTKIINRTEFIFDNADPIFT